MTDQMRRACENWIPWGVLLAIVLLEFSLFKRFAVRQIIWAYPPNHDQVNYLDQAYYTYELFKHEGYRKFIASIFGLVSLPLLEVPNGASLHYQATAMFCVFGPSRLSALYLNFAYWLAFQVLLVTSVRAVSSRWSCAFISLLLLLCTTSAFANPGGMFDFRTDFMAMNLWGMLLLAVLRSRFLTRWGWSLLAAGIAAHLITFRYIACAYLVAVLVTYFAILMTARLFKMRTLFPSPDWKIAVTVFFAAGVISGPVLWCHRNILIEYYVAGHVTSNQSAIRATTGQYAATLLALSYYARSLLTLHLGAPFIAAAVASLAIVHFARHPNGRQAGIDDRARLVFLLLCILVPYVVLTMDVQKTPVVGDILLPPIVIVLACHICRAMATGGLRPRTTALLTAVTAAIAVVVQFSHLARHGPFFKHRDDVAAVWSIYDTIGDACIAENIRNPTIATNTLSDYLEAQLLTVRTYERTGKLLGTTETLARLEAYPPSELFQHFERADFAILSEPVNAQHRLAYPFETQMEEANDATAGWCVAHGVSIIEIPCFKAAVRVYRITPRPAR